MGKRLRFLRYLQRLQRLQRLRYRELRFHSCHCSAFGLGGKKETPLHDIINK